jgi:hypothetical protein
VGNARAARFNWLYAMRHGGRRSLAIFLPLIGRARAQARLKGRTAWYKEALMSFAFLPRCFEA